jgi:hypothetical protein
MGLVIWFTFSSALAHEESLVANSQVRSLQPQGVSAYKTIQPHAAQGWDRMRVAIWRRRRALQGRLDGQRNDRTTPSSNSTLMYSAASSNPDAAKPTSFRPLFTKVTMKSNS